ncbi:MAG TPA: ABC transporter permease [Chthonomonadaceae bacterium]|nr:ABC transporter permease [Chthonomonadaceae bacterium]
MSVRSETPGVPEIPAPLAGQPPGETTPPAWPLRALRALAQGLGYAAGLLALMSLTFLALRINPITALMALWEGAFGNASSGHLYPLSETLVKTSPLLLTGLGIVVAWRAGLFSIGAEGQLLMGALSAAALARFASSLPGPLLTLLMILAAMAAGALWGAIAGWLRVRRNVQEVISTIMLNYIALALVGWMVRGPLQERARISPQSEPVPDAALFARIIPPAWSGGIPTRLHSGVLLAFLAAIVVYLYLYYTAAGFGLRVVGQNPEAARAARFPVPKLRMQAMAISGALCGLAGGVELLGIAIRLYDNFSPGWGYTAIPVALLGGLHPLGTVLSALFFGALTAGSGNLERFSGVPSVVINIIQAAAVLAVVGVRAWRARRAGSAED